MVLSAQAHGKLLLFGEHAVVHGFPALGLPLPLSTRVWLSQPGDSINDPDIPQPTAEHTQCVRTLVPYMGDAAQTLWQQAPWAAHIQSDVPMGRGLGSSAALTGAVARAFAQGMPQRVSQRSIWQMAHAAERKFHGQASGVDTALALGHGLLAVTPVQDSLPDLSVCTASPFALVVGVLARDTNTQTLVKQVQDQIKTHGPKTLSVLSRLGQLATLPPMLRNAGAVLGERANEAHSLLQSLGLSNAALDQSLLAGLSAGAYGGKLSGAGGGGAFVLFCEDRNSARDVGLAIRQRFQNAPVIVRPDVMVLQWNGHKLSLEEGKEPRSR
jgi:mevalonate kinase